MRISRKSWPLPAPKDSPEPSPQIFHELVRISHCGLSHGTWSTSWLILSVVVNDWYNGWFLMFLNFCIYVFNYPRIWLYLTTRLSHSSSYGFPSELLWNFHDALFNIIVLYLKVSCFPYSPQYAFRPRLFQSRYVCPIFIANIGKSIRYSLLLSLSRSTCW